MATKNLVYGVLCGVLLVGCGSAPKPIALDGTASVTINQGMITERNNKIVEDQFLSKNNWTYDIILKPAERGELITDSLRVKTFYLAHHADRIIIVGANAEKYKKYFEGEGVKAVIETWYMDRIKGDPNAVNVSFFHAKK